MLVERRRGSRFGGRADRMLAKKFVDGRATLGRDESICRRRIERRRPPGLRWRRAASSRTLATQTEFAGDEFKFAGDRTVVMRCRMGGACGNRPATPATPARRTALDSLPKAAFPVSSTQSRMATDMRSDFMRKSRGSVRTEAISPLIAMSSRRFRGDRRRRRRIAFERCALSRRAARNRRYGRAGAGRSCRRCASQSCAIARANCWATRSRRLRLKAAQRRDAECFAAAEAGQGLDSRGVAAS